MGNQNYSGSSRNQDGADASETPEAVDSTADENQTAPAAVDSTATEAASQQVTDESGYRDVAEGVKAREASPEVRAQREAAIEAGA